MYEGVFICKYVLCLNVHICVCLYVYKREIKRDGGRLRDFQDVAYHNY